MKRAFKKAKAENKKLLKNSNLELIQLMEQGEQVIKSEWSSWQFGTSYTYNSWTGTYKGLGDKTTKYTYNGVYERPNWKVRNALSTFGNTTPSEDKPLTPNYGLSQVSWVNSSTSTGGVSIVKDSSKNSSVNGEGTWGLVELRNVEEPINEVEILAKISPKTVNKVAVEVNVTPPAVIPITAPNVNPNVNEPLNPPVIVIPEVEVVNITPLSISTPAAPSAPTPPSINITINAPTAPTPPNVVVSPSSPTSPTPPNINISVTTPTINALNITTPTTPTPPTVVTPTVRPVDFTVSPTGDAKTTTFVGSNWQTGFSGLGTTINIGALTNRDYVTLNGVNGTINIGQNQTMNINAANNRAMVIDEAAMTSDINFSGTINLNRSQNVGIDLQGTHQGTRTAPSITIVNNSGTIIGHNTYTGISAGTYNTQQIAFGFNNADASNNTTMTHMKNSGTITLNSSSSAGIQLKPEDPNNWNPASGGWDAAPLVITQKSPGSNLGVVLMKADNTGTININGMESFGLLTVFNKGLDINFFSASFRSSYQNLLSERFYGGTRRVLPGGEIGRSALSDSKYTSGIYNTGTININGDSSIGVGLLQEIQEVKISGNINIGALSTLNQITGVSNISGKLLDKVEGAVGVFAGVPTMPVRVGDVDTLGSGNTATAMIGTETIELNGNITLGASANASAGAYVGDTSVDLNDGSVNGVSTTNRKLLRSGDITAKSTSLITVGGVNNYGFVVNNNSYKSYFDTSVLTVTDMLIQSSGNKTTNGRGINEGRIDVTGNSSVGFALVKGGNSSNSGTISVKDNAESSIGFYGQADQFINSGTIQITSSGSNNIGVVLDGASNFTNSGTGTISVNGTNSTSGAGIGVYAKGSSYVFNHATNANMQIGTGGIGLYLTGTGTANINSGITLSNSSLLKTTIGVYSDGNANVKFGAGSSLTIGTGAVGLYSSDASKFNNTFKINAGQILGVNLGANSTFALLSGTLANSVSVKDFLNNNASDKIVINSFGSGASLFYVKDGSKAVLDEDYTIINGSASSTSVLVGTENGSKVEIANTKKLITNTNVGLIATNSANAENSGTIESTRTSGGVGIYASQATATNAGTGTIQMNNGSAVGILGENNSTLKNSNVITLSGASSAGIYGEDSNISQDTTGARIDVNRGTSAGIYAILTSVADADKKVDNIGNINILATGTGSSAGIYANLVSGATKKLEVDNTGQITIDQISSVGIYAKNESSSNATNSVVNNSGLVKILKVSSVGIIGEKSTITNTGTGTNGIEVNSLKSAAILVKTNSAVVNDGKILLNPTVGVTAATDGLVGISLDATSTANNSGDIEVKSEYSTGISSSGGDVTNTGSIILEKKNSVGISSDNANVYNTTTTTTGDITIQEEGSVGIYAKLTGSLDKTIVNEGVIFLSTITGTPSKSAGIYAVLESGSTGKLTTTNDRTIRVEQGGSAGIYSVNNSTQASSQSIGINNGMISVTKSGSAAMIGEKSTISNGVVSGGISSGVIELSEIKTAGMIGNSDSVVTNYGTIQTLASTPTIIAASDGLVGISLNRSTGTNSGSIILNTGYSTGIYGESGSTAGNRGTILANNANSVGMAGKGSTITNVAGGNINLKSSNSTGIYGESNSILSNGGTILIEGSNSVGLFSKGNSSIATNTGTITTTLGSSAGMYGDESNIENSGTIGINGATSAGMYAKNANAENKNSISSTGNTSAGMLVEVTNSTSNAQGNNSGTININGATSAGMLGKLTSSASGSLTLTNNVNININSSNSVGIMLENLSSNGISNLVGINKGTINLSGTSGTGNIGILADKATGRNELNILVNTKQSIGIFGKNGSSISNTANATITLNEEDGIGMQATGTGTTATNTGTISITSSGKKSSGMLSLSDGKVDNSHIINIAGEGGVGIFVSDTGAGQNTSSGVITLTEKETVGIFAKNNGINSTNPTALNSGNITLDTTSSTKESLIGMFAQAETGKKSSVENKGTITINTKKSVGMIGNNATTNISDVDLSNKGTIIINNEGSAGIYAPKSTVSNVGIITLGNLADGSSAVYVSDGGVIKTNNADINLGTVNQNRVAYYVSGAGSSLSGANVGSISGYGVGVYLIGTTSSIATLGTSTPTLDYTAGSNGGNGIIGLLLKGNTDISTYTKGITVGDTVPKNDTIIGDKAKYAIGIYTDNQGTTGTPYIISTNIETGENGVGIFADNGSVLEYRGTLTVGNGTTAGTGIFISNTTGDTNKVTLNGATINLKGSNGVAAIVSEGEEFNGGNATINLSGSGVGVYGLKGSKINISGWTFNNNGNQAEEVRSVEGSAHVNSNKTLKPKMVLTHVINGETSVGTGAIVTAIPDGSYVSQQNIGLMADGIKNPGLTWTNGAFEIVNNGTIDFYSSSESTAIYSNSARVQNNGTLQIGEDSIGIYGRYDANTRKYDGAPSSHENRLEVDTTASSVIKLGSGSVGMYLLDAEKVISAGLIEGTKDSTGNIISTKNVGIYVKNNNNVLGTAAAPMTNAATINLGDGSVGIYSKGKGSGSDRNTVTNTGNIAVGKKITDATSGLESPSVAIYAEDTILNNTGGSIKVGEDGIAFYGKNSEINVTGGSVNFQNKGVLAYLENSKFTSSLGNLGATQNTMIYLKNSEAILNSGSLTGQGINIDVADTYTGAYIEGTLSKLEGVKTITLGKNSNGLYLKDATFTSVIEEIVGTKEGAKGILANESNLTNKSKISLSGDNSIGIYSEGGTQSSPKNIINDGELILSGAKTLGVFLKGYNTFVNNENITLAASTDSSKPTIGIYTGEGGSTITHKTSDILVGERSIGIYSKVDSSVEIQSGKIHVKDEGIGIYKQNGDVKISGQLIVDAHTSGTANAEPVAVYAVNGTKVVDNASIVNIGAKSYGFILSNTDVNKTNIYENNTGAIVTMGDNSTYLYSSGKAKITNSRDISSGGSDGIIAFYVKDGGEFTNKGTLDFSSGKGNIGIYAPNSKATNDTNGKIFVGKTDDIDPVTGKIYADSTKIVYGIGMATDSGGEIINNGEIRVYENKSIGMYGSGAGTTVTNARTGSIILDGSNATSSNKIQSMTGVYVDNGATFRNHGIIQTNDSYAGRNGMVNENVKGLVGVAVMNGSTLENHGRILIDADDSYGVIIRGARDANGNVSKYAVIKNYGEIKIRGRGSYAISWRDIDPDELRALEAQINSTITSDPVGQEIRRASGTDKEVEGIRIVIKDGNPVFMRDGVEVSETEVAYIDKLIGDQLNIGISDIGFYVDTLGRTKPVDIDGAIPPINSQLIIGTEYSEVTNSKLWFVKGDVIKPFLDQIQGGNYKLSSLAGSLTWMATPVLDNNEQIVGVAMAKIPYTSFVERTSNAYNFTDGLEQRYDMNALDSIEKSIFNKLNSIGKNEDIVFNQAMDEMMGHQYANTQQRINATGNILDKEFSYLKNDWSNASKDGNKIKVFGTKEEYSTDTAGVIDYTSNSNGVVYIKENETIKLGSSSGWYAGYVQNRFDFKDIGNSKETQNMTKAGIYNTKAFDDNGSLQWTISGEGFVGQNDITRRFLVVDEVFKAKAKYYTYGVGLKNEISKEIRTTERTSIRPYGAVDIEYGRFSDIKENDGEMKLEVKGNDYYSIKPEVGVEFKYKQPMAVKTNLVASLGVAYENELGKVTNGENKARVRFTDAGYFDIRGEKDDRKGNFKADFKLGIENTRFGVTLNAGYDTKGENIRGGLGLRVMF